MGTPVDHDPFATGGPGGGTPVDHDPFASTPTVPPPDKGKPPDPITAAGAAAAAARGAAPYAAGAAAGAALGAPFGGVGAIPGAVAGLGATALTQLGGGIYNWAGGAFHAPHFLTPQELSDKALDALGIKRPGNWFERAMESSGGLVSSMFGATPGGTAKKPATTPQKELLKDFERQGVDPSVPTVGQGTTPMAATRIGVHTPVTGSVVRKGIAEQLAQTGAAAARRAQEYGTALSQSDLGAAVRNALSRFAEDKTAAKANYDAFFDSMSKAPPIPVTRTRKLLDELMGRFPSAPELTGLFTPSPIARAREALRPKEVTTPAQASRILDEYGNPMVVTPAQTVKTGGTLTVPELKELRSQVGAQLESHAPLGPESIPKGQLKRLYAALTQDMQVAARQQGPGAIKALLKATFDYSTRLKTIERLEPLVTGASAESTAQRLNVAAMARGAGADVGLLQTAKKVMTPQEWGDFGASIISRLGEPMPNAKDVLAGANFSVASYMTNWAKLSDRAKDLIFGPAGPGTTRDALDSLGRVVQAQKNVERFGSSSRSAELRIGGGLALAAIDAAWQAVSHGSLMPILGVSAASGTGYAIGKMLTSPQFARWYYDLPKDRVITPQLVSQSAVNLINALTAPR